LGYAVLSAAPAYFKFCYQNPEGGFWLTLFIALILFVLYKNGVTEPEKTNNNPPKKAEPRKAEPRKYVSLPASAYQPPQSPTVSQDDYNGINNNDDGYNEPNVRLNPEPKFKEQPKPNRKKIKAVDSRSPEAEALPIRIINLKNLKKRK
jgi:hypothetical protein